MKIEFRLVENLKALWHFQDTAGVTRIRPKIGLRKAGDFVSRHAFLEKQETWPGHWLCTKAFITMRCF